MLALVLVAQWSRYTRSYMLEILNQDFIRTARAKGLRPSRVLVNHALRAALVPLITLGGLQLPLLVGGALVTETVFSWPGMGLLFVNALGSRDYPVLMAILMVGAFVVVLGNLIADILICARRPAREDRAMFDAVVGTPPAAAPPRRHASRLFFRHRLAALGLVVIVALVLSAAFASWLSPYNPDDVDIANRYAPPLSPGHLLGSDDLGRDVLTRLMYAGQISLSVGVAAMAVTVIVGFAIGAFAAYLGGWVDVALMRVTDTMLCFPSVFLLLFVAAFVTPSLASISLMIGLTCWMELARVIYGQIRVLRSADFVAAARMVGAPAWRIILRQILPNVTAPILVAATLNTANAILLESYISFLGYGIQPPQASWGNMLTNAQSDFLVDPWLAVMPGLAITLAVTSFNFIGDGLRDALDPKMGRR